MRSKKACPVRHGRADGDTDGETTTAPAEPGSHADQASPCARHEKRFCSLANIVVRLVRSDGRPIGRRAP